MADELASIRKEIAEVSDMIGTLASIELNLHNEQAQHAVRSVHIRESVRQVHQISERLAELAAHLDARPLFRHADRVQLLSSSQPDLGTVRASASCPH